MTALEDRGTAEAPCHDSADGKLKGCGAEPGHACTRTTGKGDAATTVKLAHPKYGEVDDVYGMGMPLKFSGAQVGFDQPPPGVGEHNEAIYGGLLGYSSERIAELRRDGVI